MFGARIARGKNFSNDEDVALCKAFIKTSHDSIDGVHQDGDVLWSSVFKEFVKLCPNHHQRDVTKISKRWYDKIQPTTSKFSGVFARVKRELPSGRTYKEVLEKALLQWKLENRDRDYSMLHVWDILRYNDKFNPEIDNASDVIGDPAKLAQAVNKASSKRPVGKKRALQEARDGHNEARLEIAREFKNLSASMKERASVLREASEIALFSACNDELSKAYFDMKRRQILQEMKQREAAERQ